jgi:nickel transport protein
MRTVFASRHAAGMVLAAAAFLFAAAPAEAHKLKVFAMAEGDEIVGYAYFSGGDRAMTVPGRITAPDGTLAGELRTDAEGRFRFAARRLMDTTITVDAGDGHVASTTVAATELPATLPPGPAAPAIADSPAAPAIADSPAAPPSSATAAIELAVARQIRPLREQLDAYEDKVRLHDILGGIGFIFGLFGVGAWAAERRTR